MPGKGKGAPKGNKYAQKEDKGETISLYLTGRDIAFLQRLIADKGGDTREWRKTAKQYARNGIYREIKHYMDAELA